MGDVAAIILAAGLSRRMGTENKLLLPVDGVPMVQHVVAQYCEALSGPITVVTGHEASLVEAALSGFDVRCVINDDYASGQQSSVAFGLKHCPDADAVLIGLGDQPFLKSQDISDLLAAHSTGDRRKISVPVLGADRGNPIVIPRNIRPQLTANPDRPGCMRFTRENPDFVQRLPLKAEGFFRDIDTPAAYADLRQQEDHRI
jgi:molybdenum cofactor cytidylyltransferase